MRKNSCYAGFGLMSKCPSIKGLQEKGNYNTINKGPNSQKT